MTDIQPQTFKHSAAEDEDLRCPACLRTDLYCLSDGRYKCKHCKKKFSARHKKTRIPAEKQALLTKLFWNMQTAEQCANSLDINRKTAQNYYDLLRTGIASENRRTLQKLTGSLKPLPADENQSRHIVFWSLLLKNRVHILFPATQLFSLRQADLPEVQAISEIYTNSPSAKRNVILEKFYRRTLWARKETDEDHLRGFWRQAKINLMSYRGGCKRKFPLFIEEMAFRFNHDKDPDAIQKLQKILSNATINT